MDVNLGYLVGKLEDVITKLDKVDDRLSKLETQVNDKFKTAEIVLKVFKYLGLILLAVVTFQFGDISKLWSQLFS